MTTPQRHTKKTPLDIVERKPLKSSSVLSPEQLHSKTQRNAFNLLEREERNAKRSRLSSLLLHQFTAKYGTKNPGSMVNTFIKQAVDEFIDAYVNVHDAEPHIPKLEREIKEEAERIRETIKEARRMETSTFSKTDINEHPASSGKNSAGKGYSNPSTERTKRLEDFTDNQWPVINALLTVTEEEQTRREKQAAASKKAQFRQVLDVQLATHRQLEEQKQAEKQKISETMKQIKQTYEQEMEAQRIAREEKLHKERELRLQQIEEQKQRREHERQMKIAQEKSEMARAKRLSEEEEARKQTAKERQKQAQDALLQENEYNRQIKASIMKERQEYEKRVAEEYEKKLEAEEKARADAFKARMDHLANIAKGYESRVGVALQQQRQEEADKVMTALHAREKAEEERQRAEAETRRLKAKKDLNYNIAMIEKRQQEKEQERLAAIELRRRLEQEALDAKRQDRVAAEERRLKHIELKYNLDRQLDQLHERQRKEKAGQSDAELSMNKTLLKKLEDDPQLLNKVLDRINHPQQTQMTSRSAGGAGKNNKAAMQVSNIF